MNALMLLLLSVVPIETVELQAVEFIHHVHTDESGWIDDNYYLVLGETRHWIVAVKCNEGYRTTINLHGKRTVVYAPKMRVVTTKDERQQGSYLSMLKQLKLDFTRFQQAFVWKVMQYEIVFAEVGRDQVIVLWDMSNGRERVVGVGLCPFTVQVGDLTNSITLW